MTLTFDWLAGVAGLATVAGLTATRSMRRSDGVDPHAAEDFMLLDFDRSSTVTTADGVPLAVREVGSPRAPLTVVFAHGFCMSMGTFHFQRASLAREWGDRVRMVFYDQRGHGASGRAPVETYTVDQLGRDLQNVLALTAPDGPVVLVGHSMGGMTILSHGRQFPRRYGPRVVGAALISTAVSDVARSPLMEVLRNPALAPLLSAARHSPRLVHRARDTARSVIAPILCAAAYGDEGVSPAVAAFSEGMIHGTAIDTMTGFVGSIRAHDEREGLEVLARIPTMVAVGDRDLLLPVSHSQEMAAALSDCELVIVPGAGHLVKLEQPEVVDNALARLVERSGSLPDTARKCVSVALAPVTVPREAPHTDLAPRRSAHRRRLVAGLDLRAGAPAPCYRRDVLGRPVPRRRWHGDVHPAAGAGHLLRRPQGLPAPPQPPRSVR
jgi:pimeloyl-ACP methyl ester carboxylesterase